MQGDKLSQKWLMEKLKNELPCEIEYRSEGNVRCRIFQINTLKDFMIKVYRMGERSGAGKQSRRIINNIKKLDNNVR